MRKIATITLTLLCITAFAQQKGTFKDARDGKTYKTVKIGDFTWMAENLGFNAKGSKCPGEEQRITACIDKSGKIAECVDVECTKYESRIVDSEEYEFCKEYKKLPAKKIQEKDKEIQAACAISGRLYGWEAASKACPAGWHLPSDKAWDILLEMANRTGGRSGEKFTATSDGGTDEFGFAALRASSDWWSTDRADYSYRINVYGSFGKEAGGMLMKYIRCAQGKSTDDVLAAVAAEAAAKAAAVKANSGTFTDSRDKKTYKTIKIGNQTWLAENLNYDVKGSKCYNNNPVACARYGRLYDWKTALSACPSGWHLPNDAEWNALVATVGDSSGYKLKAKSEFWIGRAEGSDEFGFSALPGGRGFSTPRFDGELGYGNWWSVTESKNDTTSNYRYISSGKDVVSDDVKKTFFLSVRCIKGEQGAEAKAAIAKEQPKQAEQPKQQSANESCQITFPKKTCVSMPKGTCKMSGGKVVNKCP